MRYVSTRGAWAQSPRPFREILLEGLAPDGGLAVPQSYPRFTAAELAAMRGLDYRALAFAVLSRFIDDIPAPDLRRADRRDVHRRDLRQRRGDAAPDARARARSCCACPTARRSRSRTSRCSSSAAVRVRASGGAAHAQHPRCDVGGHRLLRRARDARARGRGGVHALAARAHEPLPAGADVSRSTTRRSTTSRSTARSTTARTSSRRSPATPRSRPAIASARSTRSTGARIAAQVVYYFKGYFAATARDGEPVQFAVPSGNFGNILAAHVAREMGVPIAPARARDQRERRARRVLPHRPLPSARQRRDPRDLVALDGHLQGVELRALRLRRRRARPRGARVAVGPARPRRGVRSLGHAILAEGAAGGLRLRPQHARRPGRDDPRRARALRRRRRPAHRRRPQGRARAAAARRAAGLRRDRAAGEVLRDDQARRWASSRTRPAAYVGLEERPQRFEALPADAERVKAFIAAHAAPV